MPSTVIYSPAVTPEQLLELQKKHPGVNDLFTVGTVASILQMLKLPDGTVKVLVEGVGE